MEGYPDEINPQQEVEKERILWKGKPSQVVNYDRFARYCTCFLFLIPLHLFWSDFVPADSPLNMAKTLATIALIVLPIVMIIKDYLTISTTSYDVTTQRFIHNYGIFSRVSEETELFRVKDISSTQPFFMRIFGYGNIILQTSDLSNPVSVIMGINNTPKLQNLLRKQVDHMRTIKQVREFD